MSLCAPPIISRKTESFKDIWNNPKWLHHSCIKLYSSQHRPNPRFLVVSPRLTLICTGPGQRSRAISPRPRRDKSSRFARMSRHRAGAGIRESGPGHAQSCIAHSEPQCKGDGEREKRLLWEVSGWQHVKLCQVKVVMKRMINCWIKQQQWDQQLPSINGALLKVSRRNTRASCFIKSLQHFSPHSSPCSQVTAPFNF